MNKKIVNTPDDKLSSVCEEVSNEYSWCFHVMCPCTPCSQLSIQDLKSFILQLFEHCLAPDTMGDGTGCDNMTAVIVKFKPGFVTVKNVITNGSTNGSKAAEDNGSKEDGEPVSKRQKLDCDASEGSS